MAKLVAVRYSMDQGAIHVEYGMNPEDGYFVEVADSRLIRNDYNFDALLSTVAPDGDGC